MSIDGCEFDPGRRSIWKRKSNKLGAHPQQLQSLYFLPDHSQAGVFKGMAIILHERSIKVDGLQAQCPKFKYSPLALFCCTRQILYNQPDFYDVDSLLEIHCRKQPEGYLVVFLPKFHCELNSIERC